MYGMTGTDFEGLVRDAERRAVVAALRGHPEWTLGQLVGYVEHRGRRASLLRTLTFGELFESRTRAEERGP